MFHKKLKARQTQVIRLRALNNCSWGWAGSKSLQLQCYSCKATLPDDLNWHYSFHKYKYIVSTVKLSLITAFTQSQRRCLLSPIHTLYTIKTEVKQHYTQLLRIFFVTRKLYPVYIDFLVWMTFMITMNNETYGIKKHVKKLK